MEHEDDPPGAGPDEAGRAAPPGRDRLRPDGLAVPRSDRFDPASEGYADAMAAHGEAVSTGRAGYLDPVTGLFVMTSRYLADRCWCCGRGCRHCPYESS